ncbi:MAG: hypothetical protein QW835_00445 [Candidatus Hadarchaeum sp.]
MKRLTVLVFLFFLFVSMSAASDYRYICSANGLNYFVDYSTVKFESDKIYFCLLCTDDNCVDVRLKYIVVKPPNHFDILAVSVYYGGKRVAFDFKIKPKFDEFGKTTIMGQIWQRLLDDQEFMNSVKKQGYGG